MKKLKLYWHLFWRFRKLRLMAMMEYRTDFLFWSFVSTMWTIFNFFFFAIIINVNGSIAGWNKPEMYVLLSTFTLLDAFTWSFFYHTMSVYTASVFNGEFSQILLKPVDTQLLLSIQDNSYSNAPRLFIGGAMLIWAVRQLHVTVTLPMVVLYILFYSLALLFIYSIWFFVTTFAFWVERLDNINELIPSSRRLWQVPRTVYTGIASTIFTVIFPLGLISSVPSEIFVGKSSVVWMAYFAAFTIGLFFVSRWFFHYSLRKYSSVGN